MVYRKSVLPKIWRFRITDFKASVQLRHLPDLRRYNRRQNLDVTLNFDCGLLPQDSVGTVRLTSNDPCAETTDIDLALYCNSSSVIFADGFESGSSGRWSSTVP